MNNFLGTVRLSWLWGRRSFVIAQDIELETRRTSRSRSITLALHVRVQDVPEDYFSKLTRVFFWRQCSHASPTFLRLGMCVSLELNIIDCLCDNKQGYCKYVCKVLRSWGLGWYCNHDYWLRANYASTAMPRAPPNLETGLVMHRTSALSPHTLPRSSTILYHKSRR